MTRINCLLLSLLLWSALTLPSAGPVNHPTLVAQTLPTSFWSLDPSFGSNGVASFTPIVSGTDNLYHRTFLLPDGTIIASVDYWWSAGKASGQGSAFVRFSNNGVVEDSREVSNEHIVGIQSTGKFISLGYLNEPYPRRYNPDFTLDSSFVVTDMASLPTGGCCIIVQPNNHILLAKLEGGIIQRLNSDGSVDSTFPTNVGPFHSIDSLVSQNDSGFLVQEHETLPHECSARLFDSNGISIGWLYQSFSFSPDNHCGQTLIRFAASPDGGYAWSDRGKMILRSKADGTPDTSFGTDGSATLPSNPDWSVTSAALPLAVQADSKIVFTGLAQLNGTSHGFVARLNANGSFDTSFGAQGIFTFFQPVEMTEVSEIMLEPDGSLIVVGSSGARYLIVRLRAFTLRSRSFLPITPHQ